METIKDALDKIKPKSLQTYIWKWRHLLRVLQRIPYSVRKKKVMLSHLQDALASAAGNIISLTIIFYNGLKN